MIDNYQNQIDAAQWKEWLD